MSDLRAQAEQLFGTLEVVLLGKPGNTFERSRLETALQAIESALRGVRDAERQRLKALVEKWRSQFPAGAVKARDDYYAGQACGTLKCSDQLAEVIEVVGL